MAAFIFCGKLLLSAGLLYGYYYLFLRNKRFHHYNRFYLLAATLLSLIIPFINIPVYLFGGSQQHSAFIQTLKVINANGWEEPVTIYAHQSIWTRLISIQNGLCSIYLAGLLTGFMILIRSLFYINRLRKKYPHKNIEHLKIYDTVEPGTPFSFFKSIFWNTKISLDDARGQQIFRHELFHVKEKHSADILMMELVCCIAWFNPFFHLIKKEIKALHEFLADEYAVSANNRYDYAELLVLHAINQKAPAIAHPFFHNQIKRRITMITQSNLVQRSGYFSRVMALPLLLVLISAFAVKLTQKPPVNHTTYYAGKTITAVIDAGHGGMYAGSDNGNGLYEKNITLSIAQKIKELAKEYNINIIMTRNNDALVGNAADLKEDLRNRVDIANNAKADIFISIHLNATGEKTTLLSGFDAYISKRNEHPKDRQLATSILNSLKGIYAVNETIQQPQVGIIVLDKNTCPSVCLECGYITNSKDADFIRNKDNQEQVARKILEGIVQYSNAQAFTNSIYDKNHADKITSDTISAEELCSINPDEIKLVTVDKKKNYAVFTFKNGDIKTVNLKSLSEYLSANPSQKKYEVNFTAKTDPTDSAIDVKINNIDTLPSAVNHNHGSKIFTKVEQEPEYPGGQEGWKSYLFTHLNYPQAAVDKEIKGTVLVQFIVDQQGQISEVKAIKGPQALRAESVRVIKQSGPWNSAVQNGKKVKAYKRQPIIYKLERQS
jgi:N-acetylmuramoyl-L-alanine amidase